MKILLLITGLGVGGAERQVANLADAFAKRRHQVLVVGLTGEVIIRPTDHSIRVVVLGARKRPLALWSAAQRLAAILRDFDPDVVHSHLVHANLLARVMRLFVPMHRLISSAHNRDEEGWWRMMGYRVTDRLADMTTNVSREAVEGFERHYAVRKGRMTVVYNGIDVDQFKFDPSLRRAARSELGLLPETPLLVAIGRLSEQKDYPTLIDAVVRLRQEYPDLVVAIAGDGPLREELVSMARRLGLGPACFRFLGIRNDVVALLSAADVFVLSSAWEGFPLVVAEAMACERVVVATDCGGVREALGDAGVLVPSGEPSQLASALRSALQLTPTERRDLGCVARDRVEHRYSIETAAERWLEIYRGESKLGRGSGQSRARCVG